MKIIPLSKSNIKQATDLTLNCFPWLKPDFDDYPPLVFKASLKPEKYKDVFKKSKETNYEYYVLMDKEKVIGVTGSYESLKDKDEADWLGWTCINCKYQGKGIGKKLVEFIIKKSKKNQNKKFLRVYTNIDKAGFYEKLGFIKFKPEKKINKWYTRVDMQLRL